jgi:hypothetical protein
MAKKRSKYGVKAKGCSGVDLMWCAARPTADRVRRVLREWSSNKQNFTGTQTMAALADLAAKSKGKGVAAIISAFKSRRS